MGRIEKANQYKKKLDALNKKRDYLLTAYIVLVTAYFGGISALGDAKAVLCLILSILAFVLALVFIRDRKQRSLLERSLQLQLYLQNNPAVSHESAVRAIHNNTEEELGLRSAGFLPSRKWVNEYLSGVEFLALNAVLVISFLPVFYSMTAAFAGLLGNFPPELAFFLVYLAYSLIINLSALFYLRRELTKLFTGGSFMTEGVSQASRME
jgi:hypothetical protein